MNRHGLAYAALLAGFVASGPLLGAGISVGSSSLIGSLDYSDTFTVGSAARPDGLYNDNSNGGYNVESIYGNPAATWTPTNDFSFNTGGVSTCCGYPSNTGSANGGNDALTGLAQTGGGQFNFAYGLGNNYIVQVDSVIPGDRLDIASVSGAGVDHIGDANSLAVFFRRDTSGSAGGQMGIYKAGVGEVVIGFSGVTDNDWHNYAVNFDQAGNRLRVYVDEVLKANLDLTTFGGVNLGSVVVPPGSYASYSNAAVGLGGTFVHWDDNFQVGAPVPEPASLSLLGLGGLALLGRKRSR